MLRRGGTDKTGLPNVSDISQVMRGLILRTIELAVKAILDLKCLFILLQILFKTFLTPIM
jgi:hypothetical protein